MAKNVDKSAKRLRGFAALSLKVRKAIAARGGKAAHATGKAHQFTSEEAKIAGRKGGEAVQARGTGHQFSSEEAREAGRKGGRAKQEALRRTPIPPGH
jgi:general stress protein YciG